MCISEMRGSIALAISLLCLAVYTIWLQTNRASENEKLGSEDVSQLNANEPPKQTRRPHQRRVTHSNRNDLSPAPSSLIGSQELEGLNQQSNPGQNDATASYGHATVDQHPELPADALDYLESSTVVEMINDVHETRLNLLNTGGVDALVEAASDPSSAYSLRKESLQNHLEEIENITNSN